ncbi:YhdP family protein [Desulforhopalus sp. 52FAK]
MDIDFVDPTNILLTTHILTEAQLNDDILKLLNYYNIGMPFKQTTGRTGTDFLLTINLSQLHITTKGAFQIDQADVIWDNNKYSISNAEILQNNSKIEIIHLTLQYENLFTADIAGKIDLAEGLGQLEIKLKDFEYKFGKSILQLSSSAPLPIIDFYLAPEGDSLGVSSSAWNVDELEFRIAAFKSSFEKDTFSLTLPPTAVSVGKTINADISGMFSVKDRTIDLNCFLKQYEVNDISLVKPFGPIAVKYGQGLTIENQTTSQWKLSGIATTLYPSTISYTDNTISITESRISYGDFFDCTTSGIFNRLTQKGLFMLEDLEVKDGHVGDLLGDSQGIPLEVSRENDKLLLHMPLLDLQLTSGENKNWSATFNDLSTIYPRSKLLQQYKIDKGNLIISSNNGKRPYSFKAEIPYTYPLLIQDNKPIDDFHIEGKISDDGISAVINDQMKIHYDNDITVTSDDIGFNIPAIIKFYNEQASSTGKKHTDTTDGTSPPSKDKKKVHIALNASNSNLFFGTDHVALADQITLDYDGTTSKIQLLHQQGNIDFEMEGDEFTLNGENLGDTFMGALIQSSQFHKGVMTLAAKGTFSESSALIKIEKSTLKSLNPLNNILAFLDTIPALITFSLPEYSTKGMYISSAMVGLTIQDNITHIENIDIQSPVLSMTGAGSISIPKNQINISLNLITKAKSNISKIPLLGYILTGKEKRPSIALKVTGDLANPKVENTVFKEVATLPFSLLYRTLALPAHIANSVVDFTEEENKSKTKAKANTAKEEPEK